MNERTLAIRTQTVYAGSRMADAVTPPELPRVQPVQPQEKQAPAKQNGERRAADRQRAEKEEKKEREKKEEKKRGRGVTSRITDPMTGEVREIRDVGELKEFFESVKKRVEGRPEKNPFKHLTDKDLKEQYFTMGQLEARFSQKGLLTERESISEYGRFYNGLILTELKERGIDTRALYVELGEEIEKAGIPLLAIAAANKKSFSVRVR